MKKILLLLFISILVSESFSQTPAWFWTNPLPQGNQLNSVRFINSTTGFAVGNNGTMLKTTNSGDSWEVLHVFEPKNLNSIFFLNSIVGYAVGDSGLIIKTTNGGNSWITQNSGLDTNLTDIFFLNENLGYATGFWGLILKTTNGGTTWTNQQFYYNNRKISAIDSNNIFVCVDAGTLLRTTNGGNNWFSVFLGTIVDLRDVKFINNQIGFVVGGYYTQGHLYRTTDGGNTWTNIFNNNAYGLTGIFFKDNNNGFAVGFNGTLLKTTDGGSSWSNILLNTQNDLISGFFIDNNIGIIVGTGGTVFKTSDGGLTWNKITNGSEAYIYSSYFLNQNFGLAAGSSGKILKTTNSGISWSEKSLNLISNPGIFDIHIFDNNNAVAVGDFGFYHLTTDGGETWNSYSGVNANSLTCLRFVNSSTGFAAGYWGTITKTTNSGITWSALNSNSPSISFFDIDFLDENTGFVCGSNGTILKTTNAGVNWSPINTGTTTWLRGIDFYDNNHALAVGDNSLILKTSNGGITWDSISGSAFSPIYSKVKYVTPQYAIIVGNEGKILISSDAGNTWAEQNSSTNNNLYGVTIVDTATYFVVGERGTILKTINSGTPVELTSFSAEVNLNSVILNWSTATELNNKGFEIQKKYLNSSDKSDWESIGFIAGNGTTTELNSYTFTDKNLSSGKYQYRLMQIDFDGSFKYSNAIEIEIGTPEKFVLEQNYPNPFNPSTKIRFTIPASSLNPFSKGEGTLVSLKVYDILGNEVATLVNEEKPAGVYEVEFNVAQVSRPELASGIYFYQLRAGSFVETKKMMILK